MGYLATFVHVFVTFASSVGSAPSQAANATVRATQPHKMAALQRSTLQQPSGSRYPSIRTWAQVTEKAPREGRQFLHKHQLAPITSIDCLQDKQRNPNRPCRGPQDEKSFHDHFDIGHFPSWRDGICNSNFNYFCDSSHLFQPQERQVTLERLQLFNERTMVNCGEFSPTDDHHSNHWYDKTNCVHFGRLGLQQFRPFNLAIIVADEWPSSETDPNSIDYFGRVIMAQWGLMPIYNGVDHHDSVNENRNSANGRHSTNAYSKNCPNAAVLFILPHSRQVYLSSPSCKFICESRGGPEVVAATLAGLDRGGLEEAVKMGMNQVSKILQVTGEHNDYRDATETHIAGGYDHRDAYDYREPTDPATRLRGYPATYKIAGLKTMDRDETSWVWMLRLLYVLVICGAVFSAGAFVYYVMFEKTRITRTTYSAMTGLYSRQTLNETFGQG